MHVITMPVYLWWFLSGKDLGEPVVVREEVNDVDDDYAISLIQGYTFHYKSAEDQVPTVGSIIWQHV